jgi:hypothetical protein
MVRSMRAAVCVLFAGPAWGQEGGYLRGHITGWDGEAAAGTFSLRALDYRVHRCTFDAKTLFERERRPVSISRTEPGEMVEVLAERDGAACRALIVRVVESKPARRPLTRSIRRPLATEWFAPRGNIVLAGAVARQSPEAIWLRLRGGELQKLALRDDTRFSEGGVVVEAAALKVNMRVSVRAGKNVDGEVEAYTVAWGEIVQPGR